MISVILLMAGKGKRCGLDRNKILYKLGNKPIYQYSLDLFLKYDFEIICVVNKDDLGELKDKLPKNVKIVLGGKERYDSVLNGVKEAKGDYLIIHDSARPFLDKKIIDEILNIKNDTNCILTYMDAKDTIKINDNKLTSLDRSKLILATTPQAGPKNIILDSYLKKEENKIFTDDISLVEYYHPEVKIDLIKSNDENFKITKEIDLKLASLIWREYD